MKALILALGAVLLASCATQLPANFDPASCYERRFNVYYEETALSNEAREAIEAVGRSLEGCRIERVRVIGFAEQGEADESMEVSQQRADHVAEYLKQITRWPHGVYEVVARGDARAVDDAGEARPLRRRARVVVTASPPPAR